ncbi:MAG: efflux RND transporter permease subunit [Planctomycetaceae bacterium]|nr:efflux RND transporter permease subunit [Planctomycetaceae bacterium]
MSADSETQSSEAGGGSPGNVQNDSVLTGLVEVFLRGDVAILLTIVSLILGAVSLWLTPREEEPQIVVPMADVLISASGLSAEEVEKQVTERVERLLSQIDGVEYVYSMSRPGEAVVTVRFYVGEDREDSLVKLYNKLQSNVDAIPSTVTGWVVKPVEVDDVPIVVATLWSDRTELYGDHELRRLAEQLRNEIQAVPDTNRVWVIGGRPRQIRIELNPTALAGRKVSVLQVAQALQQANVNQRVGAFNQQETEFLVDAGVYFRDAGDVRRLVVTVSDGRPVYLSDVAEVLDGPAESVSYSWMGFGAADRSRAEEMKTQGLPTDVYPAVQIAIAKRKGTNAVWVADAVKEKLRELSGELFPDGIRYRITRDYGETANEKVNELVEGLIVAVLTVIGFIGVVLGWRAALVIALAIPVCYSLTLFINLMAGYTINRVTMFALILALGLLVDDPITDVENIARYFAMRILPARQATLKAIQEVRPALILSTLAIIASFLPMAFITGMMGPYMGPMALNVPLTVTMSTVVAFVLTPWLAMVSLKKLLSGSEGESAENGADVTNGILYRFFRAFLTPLLDHRMLSWSVLLGTGALLLLSMILPAQRLVPLKMLPYDNRNEFQVIVDMPEGTTLERTDAVAREVGSYLSAEAEVVDYQVTVGTASPMDFNGMVRHYFLRQGSNVADVRVNLLHKDLRVQQSHEMILRIRDGLKELADRHGANLKLVEIPPGPPVLASITAEVYGAEELPYSELIVASRRLADRLSQEPGVSDVDVSAEDEQVLWIFETDRQKAALSGLTTKTVADSLRIAVKGMTPTVLHLPGEVDPLAIHLQLPLRHRSALDDLSELYVTGSGGQSVQLESLGSFRQRANDQTIYHKNLKRVAFVYAEVAGRAPADAIIDIQADRVDGKQSFNPADANKVARPVSERTWLHSGGGIPWQVDDRITVEWAGEGEWKITLDAFRDLGLAFAAALVGIFVILMFQTGSRVLPPVIMLAIPLTLIGILPGFWLLNVVMDRPVGGYPNPVFFTATAMIGMIALAGIVVRNSVVLIDFIHLGQAEGHDLKEAIIRSVSIRTRPILLTAGTTLLGNWVITLDPIFSGLAWAIIFGLLTSTLFTLIVIPVVYWLIYSDTPEQTRPA